MGGDTQALFEKLLKLHQLVDSCLADRDDVNFVRMALILTGMEDATELALGSKGKMLVRQVRAELKKQKAVN